MLSDNPSLIQSYASIKHSQYKQSIERGVAAPLSIIQSILKDDWSEFERVMPFMKKMTVPRQNMELDEAFYLAIAEKNKTRMEQILAEFVKTKEH